MQVSARISTVALLLAAGILNTTCGGGSPSAPTPPAATPPPPPPPTQANRAPTVALPIFPVTLVRDQPKTFDAAVYFSDPDGDVLAFSTTTNDPLTVVASVTGSQVTLTPLREGTVSVTVTARDPGGLSTSLTFPVTVGDGNRPPNVVGRIPDQMLSPGGSPATVDVSALFADPDGDHLMVEVASSDSGVVRAVLSESQLILLPVDAGAATVTLTATDPGGLSISYAFEVTVGAGNRSPMVTGEIADQLLTPGGSPVTVDLATHFSDPDGDELTFQAISSDPSIVRAVVSEADLILIPLAAGTATITATATDRGGLSVTQTLEVKVGTANRAPTTTGAIPDQSLAAGGNAVTLDVSVSFTDPDGDVLRYTVTSSDSDIVLAILSEDEVILRPVADGTATITVTATDPAGLTAMQVFEVTVSAADDHGNTEDTASLIGVPSTTNGDLEIAGDVDYFRFELSSSGVLTVYTTGTTDTVGLLTGPNGLRESNDDSGDGSNFRIVASNAVPGTYHIAVRGYTDTSLGDYELHTSESPSEGTGTSPTAYYDPTACVLLLDAKLEFVERGPLVDLDPFLTFAAQFDYGCGPVPSGFIEEGLEPRIGIFVRAAFYDTTGKVGDFEETLLIYPRYDSRTRWLCGNPTGAAARCSTGYDSSDFVGEATVKYAWQACYWPWDRERCQYPRLPE